MRRQRGFLTMQRQRGFLTLILVILIVVIAGVFTMAGRFYFSTTLTVANQFQDKQAYYLALGGLEHGIRAYKLNNAYAGDAGTLGGVPYDTRVFLTDFAGAALPSNQKRIRGVGVAGNTTRIVEAIVELPSLLSKGNFDDAFCSSPIPWTITSTSDAPAPNYCGINQGNPGNSLLVQDSSNGNTETVATETVNSFHTTGSTNFTVKFQYRIPTFTGNNDVRIRCCFNNNSHCTAWQDYNAAVPVWTNESLPLTVPNNQTVTNFRINIEARGNGTKIFLVDNFEVSQGGSSSIRIVSYRDVFSP